MKKATLTLVAVLLAGCGNMALERQMRAVEGQPPDFRAGYHDGCTSGLAATGQAFNRFTKDLPRYQAQPLYRDGWEDGYRQCRSVGLS